MNTHQKNFNSLEIPVAQKLYELYKKVHPKILLLPKLDKHTIGEKIETTILAAIELVLVANIESKFAKENTLVRAHSKTELLKVLFRVLLENNNINLEDYLVFETNLQEAGRMLSGWIKFTRSS